MKSKAIYLAISVLLAAALACNISNPQGPPEPTAETITIVASATPPQPADATTENAPANQTEPTPTSAIDIGESVTTLTEDGTIRSSVSIKDGEESFEGNITFPGNESSNTITVKPIGFDETTTSGYLNFSLTCSGRGNAKINYKGGLVESGSPGCGETWKIYVINGSPDSHITIRLDASGDVDWSLTVTSGD